MAKAEYKREITAEQAYQEDMLEHAYRNSGDEAFLRRADVMQKTFEANARAASVSNLSVSEAPRTVFEA